LISEGKQFIHTDAYDMESSDALDSIESLKGNTRQEITLNI
jgi:hypothetical protein